MTNDIKKQQQCTEPKINGYVRDREIPVTSSVYTNHSDETYWEVVTHSTLQERVRDRYLMPLSVCPVSLSTVTTMIMKLHSLVLRS